jgi:hypothetical protein
VETGDPPLSPLGGGGGLKKKTPRFFAGPNVRAGEELGRDRLAEEVPRVA